MATYNGHNEDASGNILLSIGNGMTATVETGTTASQAYTKGAYLYYNNRLCKVTAAIAKSATLTIGTNIAYTTLGAELTSHLRASNGNELYFDYKDGKPGYYPTASKTASQFVPFGGSTPTILANWCDSSSSASYTYTTTAAYSYLIVIFDTTADPVVSGGTLVSQGTKGYTGSSRYGQTLVYKDVPSGSTVKLTKGFGLISIVGIA